MEKIKKKNIIKQYNLPKNIIFCKKCVVSNQRPRITFDANGICSACNYAVYKRNKIDWRLRENELKKLCDRFRTKDDSYDVIVPCSGGKDGSFVCHQLKHKYNMTPLAVTWSPLRYTPAGRKNLDSFIESGFNHILGTPDRIITRKLTKLCFNILGDPFQPFIYGQNNFPLKVAVQNNISLIMYGENGEAEYGGDWKGAFNPTREFDDYNRIFFTEFPVERWLKYGISKKDLFPFMPPSLDQVKKNKIERHYFGYYKYWDPQENFYYSVKNTGFKTNPERTEGTYSKYASLDDRFDGYHYYLSYIKFGIGRCTSDAAHEIRDGKISRDEGIALVKKYDGEFPKKYFNEFLEYCDIDKKTFTNIIDSWRSDHIWYKDNKNEWKLKNIIEKQ